MAEELLDYSAMYAAGLIEIEHSVYKPESTRTHKKIPNKAIGRERYKLLDEQPRN